MDLSASRYGSTGFMQHKDDGDLHIGTLLLSYGTIEQGRIDLPLGRLPS